ncbi:FAD-dependent monooxygenase [Actinopolyspora saharensis]|uniref:FAD-dependent monooxygenase n=1 Tax=Actinopolyspora saharensis TaxID=995062 RepID=UPI003F670C8B
MMSIGPSVVIVGAGPTGLTLAADLAQQGVRCTVLERRADKPPWSGAFSLEPRTLELLDMRAAVGPFLEKGLPLRRAPLGDRNGMLDYQLLDTTFPYMLHLPQYKTERLLEEWAAGQGAEIRREARCTALRQTADSVELTVESPQGTSVERADFVVGCDGVRSSVRGALGIPFRGRDYEQSLVIADVVLKQPPSLEPLARIRKRGMVGLFPLGGEEYRIVVNDHERMSVPVEEPVTLEELRESCRAILGFDPEPSEAVWMSRYRSSQRHASCYRDGRVLLAGDAAHTHIPSGGQGLQVGMLDAVNLGWKLGAELRGKAPEGLLDSYESERLPIALRTLRDTDLSFRYETSNSPTARLLRWALCKAMRIRPVQRSNIEHFAGFTTRHPAPGRGTPAWQGTRVPDRPLIGSGRLYELFRDHRFVLVDQSGMTGSGPGNGTAEASSPVVGWTHAVHTAAVREPVRRGWPDLLLVRPDGYVAWAGGRDGLHGGTGGLSESLHRWVGPPRQEKGVAGGPGPHCSGASGQETVVDQRRRT